MAYESYDFELLWLNSLIRIFFSSSRIASYESYRESYDFNDYALYVTVHDLASPSQNLESELKLWIRNRLFYNFLEF